MCNIFVLIEGLEPVQTLINTYSRYCDACLKPQPEPEQNN
jgi:hypothetical protein